MTGNDTAPPGLRDQGTIVTQGSASPQAATLHPGLRVLRPFGTNSRGENVNVAMVRDLAHVIDREKAAMGFFVTLADPTGPMTKEAIAFVYYDQDRFGPEYPKVQILTIEGLMDGRERPRFPALSMGRATFKKAAVEEMAAEQGKMFN